MASRVYNEYKELDFAEMANTIADFWTSNDVFKKSILNRKGYTSFSFYEGPPSANGKPGIHHVMGRTVKDIFCRFKTLNGYRVDRRGGWDTHGLPVELEVEKQLGIRKDDIGDTISIADYNQHCRKTVMRYKKEWDELTLKMGYWLDLDSPYITYEKDYIETVWWVLKELYTKNLLYKGYNIQPYSPAAGTGLSSHELNMPGCYREVKDVSIVAKFQVQQDEKSKFLFTKTANNTNDVYLLAWTTTPWTLPANVALAIGSGINYLLVDTVNPYTKKPAQVVIAKKAFSRYFHVDNHQPVNVGDSGAMDDSIVKKGKVSRWSILDEFGGTALIGIRYNQLMPYIYPDDPTNKAFSIIAGKFVTTEEGTGIVHIAPTFGSDDFKVAQLNNIPPIVANDKEGNSPIVDSRGKFITPIGKHLLEGIQKYHIKTHRPLSEDDFYVKNYTDEDESQKNYKSTDVIISIILKEENKAFNVEKYTHSYPHCWRTHKPILYYPLNAWFIRTTALKERMVALNKTIAWKPPSTGTGRFGHWLENIVDWNLSRSRYWGTPLPIWRTKNGDEEKCIGCIKELEKEVAKAKKMNIDNPNIQHATFDPHRPYTDSIVLASSKGEPMYREPDLVDVWFDSGAMPYAQWHYPFSNKDNFKKSFPADYIAEGVDQTRGWFFTLHAIAVMLFDSVAFKNVIANGLILDKKGNKMSKSKGNVVDPFDILDRYGPDATRWYMIENAPPWENLKFDEEGIAEVERRFFRTLLNAYSFFALYANIDGFVKRQRERQHTPVYHLDQWIISCLHSLIREVKTSYDEYEPTRAARAIQQFVNDQFSNWYIRLNRKRFWQPTENNWGNLTTDKKIAYETLYECLLTVSQLMAPITPFFSEWLHKNLTDPVWDNQKNGEKSAMPNSIHLTQLVKEDEEKIDKELEQAMTYAQRISSLAHSIRKKNKIKVRIPLNKIILPIIDDKFVKRVKQVEDVIKHEVNVKTIEYVGQGNSDILIKKVKPNYTKLGKQYGARMKEVASTINNFTKDDIVIIEKGLLSKNGFTFTPEDVLIYSEDVSGWSVATENRLTVALDITITNAFRKEGIARDFVNRIQNLRKKMNLDVMDKISIEVEKTEEIINTALDQFKNYICTETQALTLQQKEKVIDSVEVNMDGYTMNIKINAH